MRRGRDLFALVLGLWLASSATVRAQLPPRRNPGPAAGQARTQTGPGQGPRTPYLEQDWRYWWFLNQEGRIDLRNRLCQRENPGEFTDFRGLLLEDREAAVAALWAALDGAAGPMRAELLMALAKAAAPQASQWLIPELDAGSQEVRRAATLALGVWAGDEAEARLAQLMVDEDRPAEQRSLAALAAGLLGGEAAARLLSPILEDGLSPRSPPSAPVLAAAIHAVGLCARIELLEPVMALWRARATLPTIPRCGLPLALAVLGGAPATAALMEAVEGDDVAMRRAAALALTRLDRIPDAAAGRVLLRRSADDPDVLTRGFLELSIARLLGDAGLTHLARQIQVASGGTRSGTFVTPRLSLSGATRVPFAALGLGLAGDARGSRLLQDLLRKEKNGSVASAQALALGLIGDARCAALLESRLRSSKEPTTQAALCVALGLVGDENRARSLTRLLREAHDEELLPAAATGLALLGQRAEATEVLIDRLQQRRGSGRETVAYSLGLIGDRRAVAPLIAVLASDREADPVRQLAAVALGDLVDRRRPRALAALGRDFDYTAEPSQLDWLFTIR